MAIYAPFFLSFQFVQPDRKITKVSKATATRHLTDLLEKGCIEKLGGGRSTRYRIVF
ncbi:hypothetical protein [Legionella massiliensis]|uniref:hypothetical protein n=1 Tax=Legionella massiliensis TaxID=1034943 RepID=UPI003CCBED53